jgi:hypothetical protein
MKNQWKNATRLMLLASSLASSIPFCAVSSAAAQTAAPPANAQGASATQSFPVNPAMARFYVPSSTVGSDRAAMKYLQIWGIDDLKLEATASGGLIRFSYRVVDPQKARVLNDKKNDPYLLRETSGDKLEVETAERIGKMRQVPDPVAGREYWMIFSNPKHLVRPGDNVDIVVGAFRAYGLFVEERQTLVAHN